MVKNPLSNAGYVGSIPGKGTKKIRHASGQQSLRAETRESPWAAMKASVQFSRSVMSGSLQPNGLQHARLPCSSPTPGACSTHVHRVSDVIQPSHPLSSPSPPALNLSQHQGHFQ